MERVTKILLRSGDVSPPTDHAFFRDNDDHVVHGPEMDMVMPLDVYERLGRPEKIRVTMTAER